MKNLNQKEVIIVFLIIIILVMLYYKLSTSRKSQNVKSITNFSNTDKTPKIINFNASWCYWSQKLQPIWDSFALNMKGKDIDVIDMKCDDDKNTELCNRYEIEGYPTIKLISGNSVIDFTADRTLDELMKFVEENVKY